MKKGMLVSMALAGSILFSEGCANRKISENSRERIISTKVEERSVVIPGCFMYGLETNRFYGGDSIDNRSDLYWEQISDKQRRLVPRGGTGLVNLGKIDESLIDLDFLRRINYSSKPINANDEGNEMPVNTVIGFRTGWGVFGTIKVEGYRPLMSGGRKIENYDLITKIKVITEK